LPWGEESINATDDATSGEIHTDDANVTSDKSLEIAIFTAAAMFFPPMTQFVQFPDIYNNLPLFSSIGPMIQPQIHLPNLSIFSESNEARLWYVQQMDAATDPLVADPDDSACGIKKILAHHIPKLRHCVDPLV